MRVAFLYNRSSEDPALAADDEIPAQSPIVQSLERSGHEVAAIACTLDLATVHEQLLGFKPDVVFNRVESLGGSDALMAAVTLLLDAIGLPYTGNSTAGLVATAGKISVKQRLIAASLPTPSWIDTRSAPQPVPQSAIRNPKFILKSVHEHASFGIDDTSILKTNSVEQILAALNERESATGRPYFAEEFVEGREINLSLLGPEPRVLPPAEIDFSAYPRGAEHIVGYKAKCDTHSPEYDRTDRRFDFPASDERLLGRLSQLAVECWRLLDLRGYARVDFRVDLVGEPWILEVNTNPCILPDSGFSAALESAGICYDDGVRQILADGAARFRSRNVQRNHAIVKY